MVFKLSQNMGDGVGNRPLHLYTPIHATATHTTFFAIATSLTPISAYMCLQWPLRHTIHL